MAVEKVFIDDETGVELRSLVNSKGMIYIELQNPPDIEMPMFMTLSFDDVRELISYLTYLTETKNE